MKPGSRSVEPASLRAVFTFVKKVCKKVAKSSTYVFAFVKSYFLISNVCICQLLYCTLFATFVIFFLCESFGPNRTGFCSTCKSWLLRKSHPSFPANPAKFIQANPAKFFISKTCFCLLFLQKFLIALFAFSELERFLKCAEVCLPFGAQLFC
jgi:hypothetical protein